MIMRKSLVFLCVIGVSGGVLSTAAPSQSQPVIDTAQRVKVVPIPNAREYFVRAGDALVDKDKIGTELTLSEKQKLVERNAQALQILREGFSYEYQMTSTVFDEAAMKSNANLRALARLLVTEGQSHAARGDGKQATNSFMDALRLGTEIPRGAPLIGTMLGVAIESIGRRSLWEIANQSDAVTARQAARRLEIIEARRHLFAEMLRDEWAVSESGVRQEAQQINNPAMGEQKAVDELSQFMATEIAESKSPYIASKQRPTSAEIMEGWDEYSEASEAKAANTIELLLKLTKSSINTTRFLVTKNQAQNALLAVTLALRAYKLEHGAYPASLTSITPDYLEQTPTDPFSLKKPLRYRVKGEKYVLYSIGPDGEDDLGLPIGDAKTKNVQPDSKGDIVAGVNLR